MREDKGKRFWLSFDQAITPFDICNLLAGKQKTSLVLFLCLSVYKNHSLCIQPCWVFFSPHKTLREASSQLKSMFIYQLRENIIICSSELGRFITFFLKKEKEISKQLHFSENVIIVCLQRLIAR